MPFIKQERRELIKTKGIFKMDDIEPGDVCYIHYKPMVEQWKANPKWTTAHYIYRKMIETAPHLDIGTRVAYELAWQVFFQLYVMPYEEQKRQENGDI